jgi:hypothetical protein
MNLLPWLLVENNGSFVSNLGFTRTRVIVVRAVILLDWTFCAVGGCICPVKGAIRTEASVPQKKRTEASVFFDNEELMMHTVPWRFVFIDVVSSDILSRNEKSTTI